MIEPANAKRHILNMFFLNKDSTFDAFTINTSRVVVRAMHTRRFVLNTILHIALCMILCLILRVILNIILYGLVHDFVLCMVFSLI